MIVPVILAGGSGTRLWPLSRALYPKQFLPLIDSRTLLQNTALRLRGMEGVEDAVVVCNEEHRFLVAEQFRAIDAKPAAIILEPAGRNTAPAIAVAALHALTTAADPVLLVLPADHHIEDVALFREAIKVGGHFAGQGRLITFGIVPQSPETGFGYIRGGEKAVADDPAMEALKVSQFVEKPDLETARSYLASGNYFWNSGIFMLPAAQVLDELTRFAPKIVEACRAALGNAVRDLDFIRLDRETFEGCPSDSIDYAVMEKTEKSLVVPLAAGWNDLGSWEALWETGERDKDRNVLVGDVAVQDVKNSYIHSTSRLVCAIGIEDHVVVETSDAVLVATRERVRDVKLLVEKLRASKREEALNHRLVARPWGSYESLNVEERFQVKRLTVKPGAKLSLQKHHHRAEHWVVVRGTALVTKGSEQFLLKEDESTYVPLGFNHRLENPGKIPLELIEVQTGSYLGEDDIARFDDVYGRRDE